MTEPTLNSTPADFTPEPGCLDGRVIAISGASDGVGRALAERCAALGASVILHGRVERKLNEIYDAIEAAGGPEPALLPIDLSEANSEVFEQGAAALEAGFGRLDALVHCAAQLGQLAPIPLSDPAQWEKTLRVNLTGAYQLTRVLLPLLNAAESGKVIFCEDPTRAEQAYWGAYGVAQGGRRALRDILTNELEGDSPARIYGASLPPLRTRLRLNAFPGENAGALPVPGSIVDGLVYLLTNNTLQSGTSVQISPQ